MPHYVIDHPWCSLIYLVSLVCVSLLIWFQPASAGTETNDSPNKPAASEKEI